MGLTGLKASDAAAKHMIIPSSDGDPSPPTPDLVNQFLAEKISVSTRGDQSARRRRTSPACKRWPSVHGGRHYIW